MNRRTVITLVGSGPTVIAIIVSTVLALGFGQYNAGTIVAAFGVAWIVLWCVACLVFERQIARWIGEVADDA